MKTKVLISCAITAQLICTFVFTYAKGRFSHDTSHKLKVLMLLISSITNTSFLSTHTSHIFSSSHCILSVDFLSLSPSPWPSCPSESAQRSSPASELTHLLSQVLRSKGKMGRNKVKVSARSWLNDLNNMTLD